LRAIVTATLIHQVAARHGIETSYIESSAVRAQQCLDKLRSALQRQFPLDTLPGVEVLVSGSIAKYQCTRGSDVDYFGVTEQPLAPGQAESILRAIADSAQAMGLDMPFAEGSNGVFVPRSELETFSVVSDDIRRVFRRMTLVNGSVSAYRPELRAAIIRNTLSALVGRERTPRVRGVFDHVLHLARLGNLVAEWRMQHHNADGGYVQWAKCFTLYRVECASSLAAVIRASNSSEGRSREELVEALAVHLDQPPVARLLAWYDEVGASGQDALATVLAVTNDALRLFDTEGVRPRLATAADDEPTRELYRSFEQLMRRLNQALVQLFYREPAFQAWTEQLGVFG
jgi:hypothetical protein